MPLGDVNAFLLGDACTTSGFRFLLLSHHLGRDFLNEPSHQGGNFFSEEYHIEPVSLPGRCSSVVECGLVHQEITGLVPVRPYAQVSVLRQLVNVSISLHLCKNQ